MAKSGLARRTNNDNQFREIKIVEDGDDDNDIDKNDQGDQNY